MHKITEEIVKYLQIFCDLGIDIQYDFNATYKEGYSRCSFGILGDEVGAFLFWENGWEITPIADFEQIDFDSLYSAMENVLSDISDYSNLETLRLKYGTARNQLKELTK